MCGTIPFAEDLDDPFDIYDEIITTILKIETYIT